MAGTSAWGYVYMLGVALQAGVQPAVTRLCVPKEVQGQSLVLAENVVSMVLAVALSPQGAFGGWKLTESLMLAGTPAFVYAVRSLFKQSAYRRCDGVTFNIINQMKVVFCAVATWLLTGECQTFQQCMALFLAMCAGALLVLPSGRRPPPTPAVPELERKGMMPRSMTWAQLRSTKPGDESDDDDEGVDEQMARTRTPSDDEPVNAEDLKKDDDKDPNQKERRRGSNPLLAPASLVGLAFAVATAACSGLGAALSQVAMRQISKPSTVFNFELALWGAPFAVVAGLVDRRASGGGLRLTNLAQGWNLKTLVPVLLQAAGGLLVSRVVKEVGGVAMGLCTVAGIAVSAAADAILTKKPPTKRQIGAASLAALSIALHQMHTLSWIVTLDRLLR